MTAAYAPQRQNLAPALLAAAVLHIGVFAALVLFASRPSMIPVGSAVPITIVSSAPVTDSRAAEVAPETQAAAVETPVPQAPPPVPAAAAPAPAPPKPVKTAPAVAKPVLTPVKPTPVAKPQPARPAFDLDALQASIARAAHSAPARPAAAPRGPTRAETAPQARVAAGQGVSQSSMQGLQQLLERLWNPNCNVQGGDAVTVPLSFAVGPDGRLVGRIAAGERTSPDPVVAAAARRAIDAVHEAEPYAAEYRGNSFKVIFDAHKACAT